MLEAEWTPPQVNTDRRIGHLKISQRRYSESNPEPPALWHNASTSCFSFLFLWSRNIIEITSRLLRLNSIWRNAYFLSSLFFKFYVSLKAADCMVCIYTEYFASESETAAMRFSTNVWGSWGRDPHILNPNILRIWVLRHTCALLCAWKIPRGIQWGKRWVGLVHGLDAGRINKTSDRIDCQTPFVCPINESWYCHDLCSELPVK
jgi:hypothetical protein